MTTDNNLLQARESLSQALDLRRERRYAEALEKCEAALGVDPQDPRPRSLHDKVSKLKAAFDLLSQPTAKRASEEAIQCLEQALAQPLLELEVDMSEVIQEERRLLQEGLLQTKRAWAQRLSREAIRLFREATGPRRREAYQEAEAKLRQVLELDPENRAAIEANLAAVQEQLQPLQEADEFVASGQRVLQDGDYEAALRHFEAALARDEFHRQAARGQDEARDRLDVQRELSRGETALAGKDYAQAVKHFEMAHSLARRYSDLRQVADERLQEAQRQLQAQGSYEGALARAREALQAQDFDAAVQHFTEALAQQPGDPIALAGQKNAENQHQMLSEMLQRIREALDEEPPNFGTAKLYAGQAFARFGKSPAVQELWLDTLLRSGQALLKQESYAEATQEFEAILEHFPNHPTAVARRQEAEDRQRVAVLKEKGQEAFGQGQFAEAEDFFAQALEVGEAYADLRDELGVLVRQAKEAGEARNKLAYFTAQARHAREQQCWDEVIGHCEQALKLNPEAAEARAWLDEARQQRDEVEGLRRRGQEALAQGEHEQAVATLERAHQLWPAHEPVIQALLQACVAWGESLLRRERWVEAAEAFGQALRLAPEHEAAQRGQQAAQDLPHIRRLVAEGEGALAAGRAAEALRALQEAAERAEAYPAEARRVALLLQQAEEAAEKERAFSQAHRQAAEAHQAGRLDEVVRWLEEALKQKPGDAETERLLRQARRDKGAFEQALERGEAALAEARQAHEEGRDDEARAGLRQAATQFDAALQLVSQSEAAQAGREQITVLEGLLGLIGQAKERGKDEDFEGAVALLEEAVRQHPDDVRLPLLLQEYAAERDRRRQARAKELRQRADEAWNAGQHALARDLYSQVWQLVGDLEAKARADQVDADEQRRQTVQRLADEGGTFLKQADYGRAVERLETAVRLLLREGEVDEEAAALVRQASAGDLVDRLNARNTHDAAWGEMRGYMAQAEPRRREGRDTTRLLDVASRLLEALRRKAVLGAVQSAMVAEEYEKAVQEAERALNLDPGNERLIGTYRDALNTLRTFQDERASKRIEVARTALGDGDYAQALVYLKEAVNLSGMSTGVREEAERLLHQAEALEQIAEGVRPYIAAAKQRLDAGEYDEAIAELERAQREDPEEKAAIEARQVQQLLEMARQRRERSLEQQVAERLNAARALIVAARSEASLEEAMGKLREALELVPDHAEARGLLAQAEEKRSRFVQLADLKEKAREDLEVGNVEAATSLLEQAQALDPADGEAIALLSRARQRKAAADRAKELLSQGRTALGQRDYARAVECFGQLYGLDPSNEEVVGLLRQAQVGQALQAGQQHFDAKEYEQAASAYRRALDLDPENRQVQDGLKEAKERAKAQQELEALLGQAQVALQIRNYQGALGYLGQALQKAPQHTLALQLKEQAEAAQRALSEAQGFLQAARQALQNESFNEVIEQCQKALALDETNPEALSLKQQAETGRDRDRLIRDAAARVRQALEDQDYEQARVQADRLRELEPQHRELDRFYERIREGQAELHRWREQLELARFYLRYGDAGQLAEAIRLLEEYLRVAPQKDKGEVEAALQEARARQANGERMATLIAEAREHQKAVRYAEALAALEGVLAIDKDHFEATQLKGEVLEQQKRLREAERLLGEAQQALTMRDYIRALEHCGRALALAPGYAEALKLREKIEAYQQRSVQVAGLLAQARASLKALRPADLPEQALGFIAQALKLEPANEEGMRLRQEALEHQERANKLLEHLQAGREALQGKRYDDALLAFDQALELDRANEEARRLRTQAQRGKEHVDEVERWVQQGKGYLRAEAYEDAAKAFQNALAMGPDDETHILALLAEAAEKRQRKQVYSLLQQARQEIEAGNYEKAEKALDELRGLAPDDLDLLSTEALVSLLRRGETAQKNGEYQKALELYGQAQELWPASRRLAGLLAHVRDVTRLSERLLAARDHVEARRYDQAMTDVQGILAFDPRYPEAQEMARELLARLLRSHMEARRYDQAIADIQGILAFDPRYPEAQALAQGLLTRLLDEARNAQAVGEYRTALGLCAQALTLTPEDETARTVQKTLIDEAANQVAASVAEAEKALQEDNLTRAGEAIRIGLRIEPENEQLLALRDRLGARERARREADLLVKRGRETLRAADYGSAKGRFEEALKADGRHRETSRWLQFTSWLAEGLQRFQEERYDEAAGLLGQAVALFPASSDQPPEVVEARRWQQEAEARDTVLREMVELLADAERLREGGDYPAARGALRKLLKLRFPGESAQPAEEEA